MKTKLKTVSKLGMQVSLPLDKWVDPNSFNWISGSSSCVSTQQPLLLHQLPPLKTEDVPAEADDQETEAQSAPTWPKRNRRPNPAMFGLSGVYVRMKTDGKYLYRFHFHIFLTKTVAGAG
jgi:hypothetical protein